MHGVFMPPRLDVWRGRVLQSSDGEQCPSKRRESLSRRKACSMANANVLQSFTLAAFAYCPLVVATRCALR